MNNIIKYKKALFVASFILGFAYYWLVSTSFMVVPALDPSANSFRFYVGSNIKQEVKLQVYVKDGTIKTVRCNNVPYTFKKEENNYPFGEGEEVVFPAVRGLNTCSAYVPSGTHQREIHVKQKIGYFDFFVMFFLSGVPATFFLFSIFLKMMDIVKTCFPAKKDGFNPLFFEDKLSAYKLFIIYSIILLGIGIRYWSFNKFGVVMFQHDWHSHIELFKYIADNNWTLPLTMKGLEFPQQPIYYILSAWVYTTFPGSDPLISVGWIAFISSAVFLYYGYKFINLVAKHFWVKVVAISFLSFTPSIVYISARINNDALVLPLAAFSLYYIILSYHHNFNKYFFHGLVGVSLLFWTKLSGAPIELLLFALLLSVLYKDKKGNKLIENKVWWFALSGVFALSFLLMHSWQPVEQIFNLVNSTEYPGQTLNPIPWNYAFTFYFTDLLEAGQSHIFGADIIRESFLTYQFGTMFFGEFDYKWMVDQHPNIYNFMKMVLGLGVIYVVGFVGYILGLRNKSNIHKILFVVFAVNAFLILKFFIDYPSLCNTDFRYFAASFPIIALMFADGLYSLFSRNKVLLMIPTLMIILLHSFEFVFFFELLSTSWE